MADFGKENTSGFIWTDTEGFEWIPALPDDSWQDTTDDQWEDTTEVLFEDTDDVEWEDTTDVIWSESIGDQWEDTPEESTIVAETPVFDPLSGEYLETQLITITTGTSGATIYYTEDGSTPGSGSTEYTAPFSLLDNKTIKAVAIASGYSNSPIASETYTVTGTVVTPVITPAAGERPASTLMVITTTTPTASIYYTEDGSTPDASDTLYTVPFALTAAKTIKAIGIKDNFTDSGIVSETYTIGGANVGDTLSVDNGTWLWNPSSYTYQWTRDTVNITDADESTYLVVIADSGTAVACKVTATNSQGSTEQLSSNSVDVV